MTTPSYGGPVNCGKPWTDSKGEAHSCVKRQGHKNEHRCGCGEITWVGTA